MKRLSLALIAGLFGISPALADFSFTQGTGPTAFDFTCFASKHCFAHVNITAAGVELFTVGNPGQVTVANSSIAVTGTFWQTTQPVSGPVTDVQLRATPVPVSGPLTDAQLRASGITVQNTAAIVGQTASGSALTGNPVRLGLSDGTNAQNWLTALPLGDGVNGNNTAAVAGWIYNGTTWDRARGDVTNGAWVNVKTSALPSGAATAVKQPALGTAGSASADVLSVQGIASMTPFLVNPGTAANWGVGTSTQNSASVANGQMALGQFNTTPTTITSGNMSPLQMDNAGNLLVNIKAGAGSGGTASTFAAGFPSTGTAIGMSNGTNMVAFRSTAYGTTPTGLDAVAVNAFVTNTNANGVATAANSSPIVQALDLAAPTGNIAANNTTAVVVNAAATTVYSIQLAGLGSAPAYLKLYNATSATCGSGTPVKRLMIPAASTAANGAGSNITFPVGVRFSTGLTYCVTTGITDADTSAPAASTFLVNIDWH